MALSDFLFGSQPKMKKLSTLNSQQQQVLSQILSQINPQQFQLGQSPLFQQGSSFLQNLLSGSPESTQAFEAPLMRQFQEQIIPGLAERFSGLGAGAQSSSAFQQALGSAGADLSERLAALRGGLQMQALPQALGFAQAPGQMGLQLANLGLGTQSFAYGQRPGSEGFLTSLLSGLLGGASGGFGKIGGLALGNKLFPKTFSKLTG